MRFSSFMRHVHIKNIVQLYLLLHCSAVVKEKNWGAHDQALVTRGAGSGGMPPRKFCKLEVWKCYFQHFPRAICDLRVSRISSYAVSTKQCRGKRQKSITIATSVTEKQNRLFLLESILLVRDSELGISLLLHCLSCLKGKFKIKQF